MNPPFGPTTYKHEARPVVDWQALAEAHAETLRSVLLDLGFYRRDAITDAVVDKCMAALSLHRKVTS